MAALEAAIGHPDMVEFVRATHNAETFAELENPGHSLPWHDGANDVHETRSRRDST